MIEREGVRIAAVSYDSPETLQRFAEKYQIRIPLLSDRDSAVIRSFGIFNTNIAPGLRAHGVPHPVEYLIAPDGVVVRKYFVANYQHRVTASAIVLREFGVASDGAPIVTLRSGALTVAIGLSAATAFAGQEVSFFAKFTTPTWMARLRNASARSLYSHVSRIRRPENYPPVLRTSVGDAYADRRTRRNDSRLQRLIPRLGFAAAEISARCGPRDAIRSSSFPAMQRHRLRIAGDAPVRTPAHPRPIRSRKVAQIALPRRAPNNFRARQPNLD